MQKTACQSTMRLRIYNPYMPSKSVVGPGRPGRPYWDLSLKLWMNSLRSLAILKEKCISKVADPSFMIRAGNAAPKVSNMAMKRNKKGKNYTCCLDQTKNKPLGNGSQQITNNWELHWNLCFLTSSRILENIKARVLPPGLIFISEMPPRIATGNTVSTRSRWSLPL